MPLTFYPHSDDAARGTIRDRLDVLLEAAERYKAIVLEEKQASTDSDKLNVPNEITSAYNWEEIANILREIRESPEATANDRIIKSELLNKLAEVYEVLRSAKMPKLEAVRLALISEAKQLQTR